MLHFLFWLCFFIIFYSYFGYGILIYLLIKIKRLFSKKNTQTGQIGFEPEVSLVIASYNEADFIEKKIQNSLELDYPPEKLRIIIITDGSNDNTTEIIRNYPAIDRKSVV